MEVLVLFLGCGDQDFRVARATVENIIGISYLLLDIDTTRLELLDDDGDDVREVATLLLEPIDEDYVAEIWILLLLELELLDEDVTEVGILLELLEKEDVTEAGMLLVELLDEDNVGVAGTLLELLDGVTEKATLLELLEDDEDS